jgi:glycerol kinase
MTILAIDAGTTGVTALLVSPAGEVLSTGYAEFPQYFPADGFGEHE